MTRTSTETCQRELYDQRQEEQEPPGREARREGSEKRMCYAAPEAKRGDRRPRKMTLRPPARRPLTTVGGIS